MNTCPYCSVLLQVPTRDQLPQEATKDHILSEFLGGRKTVAACRGCNNTFGRTFEAQTNRSLIPLYVKLAAWGVPLPQMNQWWKRAYEVDGAMVDLSIGAQGVRARSSRPIILRDDTNKIEEAYFSSDQEHSKFLQTMQQRAPGVRWVTVEKRIETNLRGLRFQFETGPAWQQAALKICLAASTLLPETHPHDRRRAGEILRAPVRDPYPIAAQYFYRYPAVDGVRPHLAHTFYVEHVGHSLRGMVQFFGTFQLFCELSTETHDAGDNAVLGWVDPVDLCERLETVQPIGLKEPHASFDLIAAQLELIARFHHAAVQRGATSECHLEMRVPAWR